MLFNVTRSQAAAIIAAEGHEVTHIIEGQPGIGKTSIGKDVQRLLSTTDNEGNALARPIVVVDCTMLNDGDLAVPVVSADKSSVKYALNELFQMGLAGIAPIIVLDEFGKAPAHIQNALAPLMLERRLFSTRMTPGTVVFATKNLSSDNVGENELQGHVCNRLSFLSLQPPTANEWVGWASQHLGFNCPEIVAFANQNQALFATYTDSGAETNKWIYNPSHPTQSRHYASPRSLEMAARSLKHYRAGSIPQAAMLSLLSGKIGPAAASLLWQYVNFAEGSPDVNKIAQHGCKVEAPRNAAQHFMVASSIVSHAQACMKMTDRAARQVVLSNLQDYAYGDPENGVEGHLSSTAQHLTSFLFCRVPSTYLATTQARIANGIARLAGMREWLV